jgi:hypothetical protein
MSDEELDPIDSSLGALFGEERTRGVAPAGTKERAWSRLAGSLPGGGGGGGGSGGDAPPEGLSTAGRVVRFVATLALGGTVGAVVARTAMPPKIVYVDRAPSAVTSAPMPTTDPPPSSAPLAVPAPSESPSASTSSSARPIDRNREESLAAERSLLDIARTALGRGDGANALEAADRHTRDFPHGQLTEEREAIAIQALVKLGRTAEARARADRFRARYPHSVLLVVVDAAVGASE